MHRFDLPSWAFCEVEAPLMSIASVVGVFSDSSATQLCFSKTESARRVCNDVTPHLKMASVGENGFDFKT